MSNRPEIKEIFRELIHVNEFQQIWNERNFQIFSLKTTHMKTVQHLKNEPNVRGWAFRIHQPFWYEQILGMKARFHQIIPEKLSKFENKWCCRMKMKQNWWSLPSPYVLIIRLKTIDPNNKYAMMDQYYSNQYQYKKILC